LEQRILGLVISKSTPAVVQKPALKEYSLPGESERDFRVRMQQKAREYAVRLLKNCGENMHPSWQLAENGARAEAVVEREKEQAKQQKIQTALSFGSTVLGGFLGNKILSSGSISKAKTTLSGVSRSMKEAKDIQRAKDTVNSSRQKLEQMEADFKSDTDAIGEKIDPSIEQLEDIVVRPAKKDISVQFLALGWFPYWQDVDGIAETAW
jgi:hypothetical protein